ncbi:MAG: hypothetical protein K8823_378 [Cenarchaeum symbiont of Oopsacas minuta]|nr:hypothetical protein [Cenarchaeum symbiont of Oopsacas minuta]
MFENIMKMVIPKSIVSKTFNFLQRHGKDGKEAHAVLAGFKENQTFVITHVLFPKQNNSTYTYEVLDGEDHKINVEMYKLGIIAIAQIHTHPANAYHSSIDDDGSVLVLPGSFSIVIPDYGYINKMDINNWAVYRYIDLKWKWISNYKKKKMICIK